MVIVAPAVSFQNQRAVAGAAAAVASDTGGFPLGHCVLVDPDAAKSETAIQFWQQQPMTPPRARAGPAVTDQKHVSVSTREYVTVSGTRTALCHDCGNQKKKDCPHDRCRKCCKRSGLDCTTHVRSTWVPVSRRRERHQLGAVSSSPPSAPDFPAMAASKKPRLLSSQTNTSTSKATTPRSIDTFSSHQDSSFRDGLPRQARMPAVFRCVRVTSIDDGENDQFAYQASVSINGHMFRGLLYDQGSDDGKHGFAASAGNYEPMPPRTAATATRSMSDLHLGSSASTMAPDLYNNISGSHIRGGLGYGRMVTP